MRSLEEIGAADVEGADIVHLAYLTKEKVELMGDRAFFDANAAIDEALCRALEEGRPHALFVASSGAAALAERGVDRHLYGVAKLLQEDRFLAYGRRSGVPVMAGRIFNIAGPYINKRNSYAISDFLDQAATQGEIRIRATLPVFRAYLHVADLVALVLKVLDEGISAPAPIDFCGSEVVEMIDIARAAAAIVGLDEGAIHRDEIDFGTSSAYLGDPVAMRVLAQRCGISLANFARQVRDTADFLQG